MPSVKCVYCGYRIIVPAPTNICPNCGKIFDSSAPVSNNADIPLTGTAVPSSSSSSSSSSSYSSSSSSSTSGGPTIVDGSIAPSYNPIPDAADQVITIDAKPRNEPQLRGMVIHINAQQGVTVPKDLFLLILKQIWDIVWPVYEPGKSERKKNITIVRVRLDNGEQREVRFEGDFSWGGLALGDDVAFWGSWKKGVLWVRRAYNHTSQAQVSTKVRQESAGVTMLIVGICLAAALCMMLWMGWLVLFPTPHFHFFLKH